MSDFIFAHEEALYTVKREANPAKSVAQTSLLDCH